MTVDQIVQFIFGIVGLINGIAEAIKNLAGFVTEEMGEDVGFVLEIQIYRSIGNAGFPRDLGDGGMVEALFGKDFDRRV